MLTITIFSLPGHLSAAETLREQLDGIEVSGLRWNCVIRPMEDGAVLGMGVSREQAQIAIINNKVGLVGFVVFMPECNKEHREFFVREQERHQLEGSAFVHSVRVRSSWPKEQWLPRIKDELRDCRRRMRRFNQRFISDDNK